MVVGYRVGMITYALALPFFRIKYFTLVNLILDRLAVPEFLQAACNPQNLADAVVPLLTDKTKAAAQLRDLDEAAKLLGEGGEPPSLRAAQAVLDFVQRRAL
jgi:lipid-A-disaccharide synthase